MEEAVGAGATPDEIALGLQELRDQAGSPSYAEIVRRIGLRREAHGIDQHAARPARSTVYDAFRTGRRRIDPDLVADIVAALGGSEDDVETWRRRCQRSRTQPSAPEVVPVEANARSARFVLVVMVGSVLLNLLGREVVNLLHLPLFLDMTGTAVAAVLLGPWSGASVGLTTNLAGTLLSGWTSVPFALVNVVGGLLWGYGVHRFGLGRTLARFLGLNLLVGLCCTVVAVPIVLAVFGGHDPQTTTTDRFLQLAHSLLVAVFSANLVTSLADKLISGFMALVAADVVHHRWDRHVPGARDTVT